MQICKCLKIQRSDEGRSCCDLHAHDPGIAYCHARVYQNRRCSQRSGKEFFCESQRNHEISNRSLIEP